MDIREKIIEYIRTNKVSTTEVADCLGKTGVIPDVMPINRGQFRVGMHITKVTGMSMSR